MTRTEQGMACGVGRVRIEQVLVERSTLISPSRPGRQRLNEVPLIPASVVMVMDGREQARRPH